VLETISFPHSKAKIIGGFIVWSVFVLLFLILADSALISSAYAFAAFGCFFLILLFTGWFDQYKFLQKY
jgi:hypothetical protein